MPVPTDILGWYANAELGPWRRCELFNKSTRDCTIVITYKHATDARVEREGNTVHGSSMQTLQVVGAYGGQFERENALAFAWLARALITASFCTICCQCQFGRRL